MDKDKCQMVEGLLFASGEPLSLNKLIEITNLKDGELQNLIAELNENYLKNHSALYIAEVAGGFQLRTVSTLAGILSKLQPDKKLVFSKRVMETLAIIAYRQPITKPEIDKLRGVDSGHTIGFMLKNDLIKLAGRSNIAGNPLLYRTTDHFLEVFGFNSLAELPRSREVMQMELPIQMELPK